MSLAPFSSANIQITEFLKKLNDDRKKNIYCDFTICCGETCLPCHRIVLRNRTKLPLGIYDGSLLTCHSPCPPSTLESLLSFIYTFQISINETNVCHLLQLSSEFNIEELISFSIQYVIENFQTMSSRDDFFGIDLTTLERVVRSDNLPVDDERDVLHAMKKWVLFKPERMAFVGDVMRLVRMPMIQFTLREYQEMSKELMFASGDGKALLETAIEYDHAPATRWELQSAATRPRPSMGRQETLVAIYPTSSSQLFEWHTPTASWSLSNALMVGRDKNGFPLSLRSDCSLQLVAYGDKFFMIECKLGLTFTSTDVFQNVWINLTLDFTRREGAHCLSAENFIYIIGGVDTSGVTSKTVERVDLRNLKCSRVDDLPVAVERPFAFFANGKIYVFGYATSVRSTSIQVFSCERKCWSLIDSAFPASWTSLEAACYDGVVYVLVNGCLLYSFNPGTFDSHLIQRVQETPSECPAASMTVFNNSLTICLHTQRKIVLVNPESGKTSEMPYVMNEQLVDRKQPGVGPVLFSLPKCITQTHHGSPAPLDVLSSTYP